MAAGAAVSALLEGFCPAWKPDSPQGKRRGPTAPIQAGDVFPDNVCAVIRTGLGRAGNFVWREIPTISLAALGAKIPAAVLSGFLAEEDEFDRRSLWRLGSWGVASVAAVVLAVFANQSSIGWRRDQVAAAELAHQAEQLQMVARDSHGEAKRLASAIETLNSDRDRLFTRITVVEQGLDSVTGAIARQSAAAPAQPVPAWLAGATAAVPASSAPDRRSRGHNGGGRRLHGREAARGHGG